MVSVVSPVDQLMLYGGVPSLIETAAMPLVCPQDGNTLVIVNCIGCGPKTGILFEAVQPLAS